MAIDSNAGSISQGLNLRRRQCTPGSLSRVISLEGQGDDAAGSDSSTEPFAPFSGIRRRRSVWLYKRVCGPNGTVAKKPRSLLSSRVSWYSRVERPRRERRDRAYRRRVTRRLLRSKAALSAAVHLASADGRSVPEAGVILRLSGRTSTGISGDARSDARLLTRAALSAATPPRASRGPQDANSLRGSNVVQFRADPGRSERT